MKKKVIVVGFSDEKTCKALEKNISSYGYEVQIVVKLNKSSIKGYLEDHPECDTVLLKEVCADGKSYTADDVAEFTDIRDINVVLILGTRHKGTQYMSTLYAAGITSAVFQEGNKGVTVKDIAKICCEKRSRKDARVYYGLSEEKIEISVLSSVNFKEALESLNDKDNGENIADRFVYVTKKMTPSQAADFIKKLPDEYISNLSCYEEFYMVIDALKKYKINLPFKKPKQLKKAIDTQSIPVMAIADNSAEERNEKHMGKLSLSSVFEETQQPTTTNNTEESIETKAELLKVEKEEEKVKSAEVEEKEIISKEKKEKSVKVPKEKKEHKKIKICIGVCIAAALLAACGENKDDNEQPEPLPVSSAYTESSITEESVIEEVTEESLIEEPTINPKNPKKVSVNTTETTDNKVNNNNKKTSNNKKNNEESETPKATTTPINKENKGIDSKTGLVVANEEVTGYTTVIENKTTEYSKDKLTDGGIYGGIDVVNIINGNTDTKFSVSNINNTQVMVYIGGGASLTDIPAGSQYKLTKTTDNYIFTVQ